MYGSPETQQTVLFIIFYDKKENVMYPSLNTKSDILYEYFACSGQIQILFIVCLFKKNYIYYINCYLVLNFIKNKRMKHKKQTIA